MRVVVTGGSSGVGAALVERLAKANHQVLNPDVVAPAETIDGVSYVRCDLSEESSIDEVSDQLGGEFDALVNVAGIARADNPARVVAVNFLGLRHLSNIVFKRLADRGCIINVSSEAGRNWLAHYDRLVPLLETSGMSEGIAWCDQNQNLIRRNSYGFSKRLVTAFTLREAQNFVGKGKQILCVSPGNTDTPLYPQFKALMSEEHSRWMISQVGRMSTADEIAEVIDMLVNTRCARLNGVDIPVDGGYTAGLESGWIDFNESPVGRMIAQAKRKEQRG